MEHVTKFDFNRAIRRFTNITNYDIRNQALHFNNRAVNFYLDFSFLCRPVWWNVECYCITVPPCPDIIWGTVFPAFPSTTPLQVNY